MIRNVAVDQRPGRRSTGWPSRWASSRVPNEEVDERTSRKKSIAGRIRAMTMPIVVTTETQSTTSIRSALMTVSPGRRSAERSTAEQHPTGPTRRAGPSS